MTAEKTHSEVTRTPASAKIETHACRGEAWWDLVYYTVEMMFSVLVYQSDQGGHVQRCFRMLYIATVSICRSKCSKNKLAHT